MLNVATAFLNDKGEYDTTIAPIDGVWSKPGQPVDPTIDEDYEISFNVPILKR